MLSFDAPKRGLEEKPQGLSAITISAALLAIKAIIITIGITIHCLRPIQMGILFEICYK